MLTKFGAVRTRNAKMEMVYCLPAELGVPTTSSPLKNLVLDIDYNDSVVVIHTSPGAAQLIARLLDSLGKAEGILGSIAGDDTIFTTPARGFTGNPSKNYHSFNILCVFPLLYIHLLDEINVSAQKIKLPYLHDLNSYKSNPCRKNDISNTYTL